MKPIYKTFLKRIIILIWIIAIGGGLYLSGFSAGQKAGIAIGAKYAFDYDDYLGLTECQRELRGPKELIVPQFNCHPEATSTIKCNGYGQCSGNGSEPFPPKGYICVPSVRLNITCPPKGEISATKQ